MLSKLIQALTILNKYGDPGRPTHCEHDILRVIISPTTLVSDTDKETLDHLGFSVDKDDDCFYSNKYGSA